MIENENELYQLDTNYTARRTRHKREDGTWYWLIQPPSVTGLTVWSGDSTGSHQAISR